jgi:hypothetical protein
VNNDGDTCLATSNPKTSNLKPQTSNLKPQTLLFPSLAFQTNKPLKYIIGSEKEKHLIRAALRMRAAYRLQGALNGPFPVYQSRALWPFPGGSAYVRSENRKAQGGGPAIQQGQAE